MKRFWDKVEKTDDCWLWRAYTLPNGYGRLWYEGGMRYAHRFAYEMLVGPIQDGLHLDHLCRVRHCVNPAHLEPVTQAENIRRGRGGEHWAVKTHCPAGHPYDTENTYLSPRGRRECRTCRAVRQRSRAIA